MAKLATTIIYTKGEILRFLFRLFKSSPKSQSADHPASQIADLCNLIKRDDYPCVFGLLVNPYLCSLDSPLPFSDMVANPISFGDIATTSTLSHDAYHDFCISNVGLLIHNASLVESFVDRVGFIELLGRIESELLKIRANPWFDLILEIKPDQPYPVPQVLIQRQPGNKQVLLNMTRTQYTEHMKPIFREIAEWFSSQRTSTSAWFNAQ